MNAAYLKEAQRAFTCARRAKGYVWTAHFEYQSWLWLFVALEGSAGK